MHFFRAIYSIFSYILHQSSSFVIIAAPDILSNLREVDAYYLLLSLQNTLLRKIVLLYKETSSCHGIHLTRVEDVSEKIMEELNTRVLRVFTKAVCYR